MDIREMTPDTDTRLAGLQRRGTNLLHHDDFANVVEMMRTIVQVRHGDTPEVRLLSIDHRGVSQPFYVRDTWDSVRFFPDGIAGGMVTLRNAETR
jgi:hypothetical protein